MVDIPETRYVKSGDAYVAYQVVGDGDVDLLFAFGIPLSFADYWDRDEPARFLTSLASFSRLILFDRRGIGLSDPVSPATPPTVEQWMDDALAVLDAAGSTQAAVLGSDVVGSHVALLLGATHPDRVSHLVICNGTAVGSQTGLAPERAAGHGSSRTKPSLRPVRPTIPRSGTGGAVPPDVRPARAAARCFPSSARGATRPWRVHEQGREALHPPEQRHMVDLDPRFASNSSTSRYDRP